MEENKYINWNDIHVESQGPSIGLAMYVGNTYYNTYTSWSDFFNDLAFRYYIDDIEKLCRKFKYTHEVDTHLPKYRGVCSELFYPTDFVSRYICYGDTISSIIAMFEKHEKRSLISKNFLFGVQGTGIHIFNEETQKYKLWIGGKEFHSVADVIKSAHDNNKFIPDELLSELAKTDNVDVFISHKSEDIITAKQIYDYLSLNGYCTFLSEMSLPSISNSDYSFEIDNALDKAKHIIVLASSLDNVTSGWVRYEWSTFANEKKSGRKSGNIVTILNKNLSINDLPLTLRQFEVISLKDWKCIVNFLPR